MKLNELFKVISEFEHIRIFVGCQTLFDGVKAVTLEKEWNRKMHKFMDCDVLNVRAAMNVIQIFI